MTDDAEQIATAHRAAVVAAASAALGRPLTGPAELAGGGGSTVLRSKDPAGHTVIVKAYPFTAEGASSFAAEAAGLEIASDSGLTPDLLAVDPAHQTLVMSDLGQGASLADVLLGDSATAAREALLAWAAACGALACATSGRQAAFAAAQGRYLAGRPDERHALGLPSRILAAPELAGQLGVVAGAGLEAELAELVATATADRHAVFSPGDICPDNNLLTRDGVRFLDFEEAGFHSAFLDAAYFRMPFSTCWCVFRLPPDVRSEAEDVYRAQVRAAQPELADDAVWGRGLRLAVAAWTLSSTSWLLRRSLSADVPMNPDAESPGARQVVRYRWHALAAELESAGDLPAVADLMRSLVAATTEWHVPDLPRYPAFRVR